MVTIMVPISEDLKRKLDAKRQEGYTINGFVRALLTKALAEVPLPPRVPRTPRRARPHN
jgi:hypothetical protein